MATAKNTATQLWAAAASAQSGEDATHVSVWTAATGGTWLFNVAISNNPDPLEEGGRYRIAAEALVLTRSAGTGESEASAIRALRGILAGTTYWQLHTGNPGSAGTANVLTGIARLSLALSAFTIA